MTKIIVAEDYESIRQLISRYLYSKGFEVDSYEDGQAAIEKMRAEKDAGRNYDLVLTDNDMPNLSGFGLIKLVRQEFGNIPIVLMSGKPEIKEEALKIGATNFLKKPFDDIKDLDAILINLQPSQQDSQANSEQ